MTTRRSIVIGDVHGCLEELDELLVCLERKPTDRLIFLGDLMDRGPDPIGVVRRVRELGAECVLGNHEEKHLRWARHEAKRKSQPRYRNPMQPFEGDGLAQHAALTADDLAWMIALPKLVTIEGSATTPDWLVVHAGLWPGKPLATQKEGVMLRLRYVTAEGDPVRGDDPTVMPRGAHPWATRWRGPESVVYGHAVHDLATPRVDRPAEGVECWGIDTGCCFGGALTALVLPSREVVSVKAKQVHQAMRPVRLG